MTKFFLLYTDPGSGIMLLQVLLAFLASGVFYFRNAVKSLLGIGRSKEVKVGEAAPDESDKS